MDSYNFEIPILLDFEETCSDCGRELENGKNTICSYCQKRFEREWEIERQMALEPDLSHSDEEHKPFWMPTPALLEKIKEEQ